MSASIFGNLHNFIPEIEIISFDIHIVQLLMWANSGNHQTSTPSILFFIFKRIILNNTVTTHYFTWYSWSFIVYTSLILYTPIFYAALIFVLQTNSSTRLMKKDHFNQTSTTETYNLAQMFSHYCHNDYYR